MPAAATSPAFALSSTACSTAGASSLAILSRSTVDLLRAPLGRPARFPDCPAWNLAIL